MFNYCPGPVDITAHPRLRHLELKHKLQIFSNDYKDLSNLTELRSLILNGHSRCTFDLDLYEPIDIKFSCLTRLWIGGSEGGRPYHSWRNVRRLTPDGFIHAVIIANPGLKDIHCYSLTNRSLRILSQPDRCHGLENLWISYPSLGVGHDETHFYTQDDIIALAACQNLRPLTFNITNFGFNPEALEPLVRGCPRLAEISLNYSQKDVDDLTLSDE
jgi:hypothetical protein